jgi:NDP-sugar pyrophosphorylase family protein
MKSTRRAFPICILGAGLGSRLKSAADAKPLALIDGKSILSRLLDKLSPLTDGPIFCALRDELLMGETKANLPKRPRLSYVFVNTPSSLHTLVELIVALPKPHTPTLFLMADTILKDSDLLAFSQFLDTLSPHECAVLTTTFVDDEKPLWVHKNAQNYVRDFNSTPAQEVTSGIYWLTPEALEIAEEAVKAGTSKMRNFLQKIAQNGLPIKSFVVSKTIDVDHPLDLKKAEEFLQNE